MAESDGPSPVDGLALRHYLMLTRDSAILEEVVRERGYLTVERAGARVLRDLSYPEGSFTTPGLYIPCYAPGSESETHHAYRADYPKGGRKYLVPVGQANRLDMPPRCQHLARDPSAELWICEGAKKADALASHGLCAVSMGGVWNWFGTDEHGVKNLIGDFDQLELEGRSVVVVFDSDTAWNAGVRRAREELTEMLRSKNAHVRWCKLEKLHEEGSSS